MVSFFIFGFIIVSIGTICFFSGWYFGKRKSEKELALGFRAVSRTRENDHEMIERLAYLEDLFQGDDGGFDEK